MFATGNVVSTANIQFNRPFLILHLEKQETAEEEIILTLQKNYEKDLYFLLQHIIILYLLHM